MVKDKLLKQKKGAIALKLKGPMNLIVLNWKDGMVEVYHNKKRIFILDIV